MSALPALAQGLALNQQMAGLLQTLLHRVRQTLEARGPLAAQLDEAQVLGYEFAFIKAELHAMESMLEYGRQCANRDSAELETRMALVFAADTIAKVRARFDRVRHPAGLTRDEYLALFEQPALHEFCAAHASPEALAACGSALIDAGHCGRSLLSEDQQIIAASFARVAEEVVAPRAEDIHRHDLTVPDDVFVAMLIGASGAPRPVVPASFPLNAAGTPRPGILP